MPTVKKTLGFLLTISGVACCLIIVISCATPSAYEQVEARRASANPSAASYGADSFSMEWRKYPERPNQNWNFYFKHCQLDSRGAWPTKDEWSCTEPR